MCSRGGGLLVLLLSAVGPRSLAAQDPRAAKLRERSESLLVEWRRASTLADVVDSLERERASMRAETVAVGALRIIANPSPLPLHEAAERAWPAIDSLYGPAAESLTAHPYLIRAIDPDTSVRRATLRVGGGLEVPWDFEVAATAALLLNAVPMPPTDPALTEWLGAPLKPSAHPDAVRAAVYVEMVTAPSQPVRQCFLGDLARCRAVLGIPAENLRVEHWYATPIERRTVVTGPLAVLFDRGANAPRFRQCGAGRDAACLELLRSLRPQTLPKPLGYVARATLLDLALRTGGRDAYVRLLSAPTAPLAGRIASAAAVSSDTLMGRWRAAILSSRPRTVSIASLGVVGALLWTALFGWCGLRSSRWRL